MAKTQEDLIRRALQILGAVSADEPISNENATAVRDMIVPMLDDLRLRGIWDNGVPTSFDDGPFLPLSTILAALSSPYFGAVPDPAIIREAEMKLRFQQRPYVDTRPIRVWVGM